MKNKAKTNIVIAFLLGQKKPAIYAIYGNNIVQFLWRFRKSICRKYWMIVLMISAAHIIKWESTKASIIVIEISFPRHVYIFMNKEKT